MGNVLACLGISNQALARKNSNKLCEENNITDDNINKVFQELNKQYPAYKINSIGIETHDLLTQYPEINESQHQIINLYYDIITDNVIRIDIAP